MTYYVGLDVSLRSVNLCVIDDQGEIVSEAKVDSEPEDIVAQLDSFKPQIKALALEAGTLTQYLTYGLQQAGYVVICMEARQVHSALAAMRNKTDKNDARGIAQILRTGWYSQVHVKSIESHHIRALLSARKAVLKKCVDLENEVRGLFKVFGIKLPSPLKHGAFDHVVRERIESDPALAHALLPLLDARLVLYKTFLVMEGRAKKMAAEDEICRRLMTAPGVGAISALTYKAAVDDPKRFKRSRTVAAHFGLTPRRFQSGEMDNMGGISKAGDPTVRAVLYAAANALLTRTTGWSELKAWGMNLMKTKGRRKAVVAVSRKFAVILHRMWIDGNDFQWTTEGAMA
ncbi:MAG: IS110 family transposase [Gammaproteobacteria bacterium]|nr:IS110 family transposase [Gammaproteobacteria bacterium]